MLISDLCGGISNLEFYGFTPAPQIMKLFQLGVVLAISTSLAEASRATVGPLEKQITRTGSTY